MPVYSLRYLGGELKVTLLIDIDRHECYRNWAVREGITNTIPLFGDKKN